MSLSFSRSLTALVAVSAAVLLVACSKQGESQPPPTNVRIEQLGDQRIVLNFDAIDGVQYWVYQGGSASLSPSNWSSQTLGRVYLDVRPPLVFCGVTNGSSLYYTVTARTGGGPGGDPSPVVGGTARAAGATWTAGTPLAGDLTGVAFVLQRACTQSSLSTGVFAAVGRNGAVYTSADGANWTARSITGLTTDLLAVGGRTVTVNAATGTVTGQLIAVGAGGAIAYSGDNGTTWTQSVAYNAASPALRAALAYPSGFVVVGDNGTILTSTDGQTWNSATSNTTAHLRAAAAVVSGAGIRLVAAGDNGTIATSDDAGVTWTVQTIVGAGNLVAGVFGNNYNDTANTSLRAINTLLLVSDSGVALRSTDGGSTWTSATVSAGAPLVGVSYITRFVALDANGNAYVSALGDTWTAQATGLTGVRAVTTDSAGYVAVGTGGLNARAY